VNRGKGTTFFISYTYPALDHVHDLRRAIADVSGLRNTLAHEQAHLLIPWRSPNSSGMTAAVEAFQWLAGATRVDERPQASPADAILARTPPMQDQDLGHDFVELPTSRLLMRFVEDVLNRIALLRFLASILAPLCLRLARVLAACSRRPGTLAFLLVMLAVCRRYGRHDDPDDHHFLPMRRYLTSWGGCPQG
jgi:hypothetical protein